MISEGDADIAAGRTVDEAKVDARIDSIGTGHESPHPFQAADPAACREN